METAGDPVAFSAVIQQNQAVELMATIITHVDEAALTAAVDAVFAPPPPRLLPPAPIPTTMMTKTCPTSPRRRM